MSNGSVISLADAIAAYEASEMDTALAGFLSLADKGEMHACLYLGLIFKTGDGVEKNEAKANFWYARHRHGLEASALQGDLAAVFELAKIYQFGDNVQVDYARAMSLLSSAADHGHAGAQFHLAAIYNYGWCGYARDPAKYRLWLERAVANRHPEALYTFGVELVRTPDTRLDGIEHITRAAIADFWPAQEWLALNGAFD